LVIKSNYHNTNIYKGNSNMIKNPSRFDQFCE